MAGSFEHTYHQGAQTLAGFDYYLYAPACTCSFELFATAAGARQIELARGISSSHGSKGGPKTLTRMKSALGHAALWPMAKMPAGVVQKSRVLQDFGLPWQRNEEVIRQAQLISGGKIATAQSHNQICKMIDPWAFMLMPAAWIVHEVLGWGAAEVNASRNVSMQPWHPWLGQICGARGNAATCCRVALTGHHGLVVVPLPCRARARIGGIDPRMHRPACTR